MISARFTALVMRVMLSTTPTSAQVCEILTSVWKLSVTCALLIHLLVQQYLCYANQLSWVLTSASSNTLLTWIAWRQRVKRWRAGITLVDHRKYNVYIYYVYLYVCPHKFLLRTIRNPQLTQAWITGYVVDAWITGYALLLTGLAILRFKPWRFSNCPPTYFYCTQM